MARQIRTFSGDEALVVERRKQIVSAASKMFLERGYEHTNTRELTEALGMSKGALYHYIGAKQDILYLVIEFASEDQQKLIGRMRDRVKGLSSIQALRESIWMYFANVDELQDMYNFTNHAIADLARNDRRILFDSEKSMVDYFEALLRKGTGAGALNRCDLRLVAHNIVVVANAWANRRWFLRRHYTLEEYTREVTEQILRAMCTGTGPVAEADNHVGGVSEGVKKGKQRKSRRERRSVG
jgi:AcrR family transcriptional regulator